MIDENVFYLVYSLEHQGYVKPSELSEEDWDANGCGAGVFALIEINDDGYRHLPRVLQIKAVYGLDVRTYNLEFVERNLCKVSPEHFGDIFFKVSWKHRQQYVGWGNIRRFATLTPTDIMRLEELCLEHRFIFVGE